MCQIAISIPNEVLYDTRMSMDETIAFAKRTVALGYYTQSGVSLGYCAQIAGMSKLEFIRFLGSQGISIFHFDNEDEFLKELDNAKGHF